MIEVNNLIKFLKKNRIEFFTGVPDSILKNFSLKIENYSSKKHIITTNEGSAVALGAGYYLSKKLPLIYMQNSGLGNAVNPLISLTHKNVYSIPMLIVIGWRGAPGTKDEVQHSEKGKITKKLLNLMKIKNIEINEEKDFKKLKKLIKFSRNNLTPVACLVKKNTLFNKKGIKNLRIKTLYPNGLTRSYALEEILKNINNATDIISTTGFTSREVFQIRLNQGLKKRKGFLHGGSNGSFINGYSWKFFFKKKVSICLDGDGAALMHLGAIAVMANFGKKNLKYILFNNSSHESVGGQKTIASKINFQKISRGFNFKRYFVSSSKKDFKKKLSQFMRSNGPSFFEIKIQNKSMKNLSRPRNLKKYKELFLNG